jgi:tetratricopeptide (TPR) repeat protein
MDKVKKEGTDAYSAQNYKEAIEKFTECLELDPNNNNFNSSILFNRASAYIQMGL